MSSQTSNTHLAAARRRGAQQGFTLIELMIVVAVIAVLAVVAFASYDWATTKTRRKEAAGCITQGAQFMERFYATNLRYDKDLGGLAVALPAQCPDDLTPYYTVALAATTATTYTITATPQGTQATRDTTCGVLSMDQTGKKMYGGGTADTSAKCW
ncbi:MAG: prepilin-type N-terminal cleavage/methylation domain-containing protein [Proteobacteria bacterium]|nr:prepilin-type N-terminal cleavage/methylation domain-containing protein [Pseudomonadota bacterium]